MKSENGRTSSALNCPNCGAAAAPDSVKCEYCRSTLVAGTCGSCFGTVFVGLKHCPWCGAAAPASLPDEPACLRCPRCCVDLLRTNAGPAVLHECRQCGGIWVDQTEFREICTLQEEQEAVLLFSTEKPPAGGSAGSPAGRVYVPCAACGKLMNRSNFAGCSGVILDWCRDHGTWFDPNELRKVVTFIRNGGLRKSREREKVKLQEEKARLRQRQLEQKMMEQRFGEDISVGDLRMSDSDVILRILSGFWNSRSD